jgi:protein involved in polysaccharide export with SLBB domain
MIIKKKSNLCKDGLYSHIKVLVSCIVALFICNCIPRVHHAQNSKMHFEKNDSPMNVELMSGDLVDVKFYYTPEINESQVIRADGKISLQLLGDIDVVGKTPEQVRVELIQAYKPHLKDPEVVVILRRINERRVYVGGEVLRPGALPIPGSLTVLEAIMEAGGFTNASAKIKNVVIIRRTGDKWKGIVVNMSKPLNGKYGAICELQPRDVVYVPRTTISKIDQWIDQHINKVIPGVLSAVGGSVISAEIYKNLINDE